MAKWPAIKKISLRDQRGVFRMLYPTWSTHFDPGADWSDSKQILVATGPLQPTEGSPEYRTRIEYDAVLAPRVWIESPELIRRPGADEIPHMYSQERVCAFTPGVDWRRDMYVAQYVPGRVSQWLFFYELWYATGEWYGGGVHPTEASGAVKDLATPIDTEMHFE